MHTINNKERVAEIEQESKVLNQQRRKMRKRATKEYPEEKANTEIWSAN